MNQEHDLEECLKMPNFLSTASITGDEVTVTGMKEHVLTGRASSLARIMTLQELVLVTLTERALAKPLRSRMHYDHPDVFEKSFVVTSGGVSKAGQGINLSEDVFSGYNVTSRRVRYGRWWLLRRRHLRVRIRGCGELRGVRHRRTQLVQSRVDPGHRRRHLLLCSRQCRHRSHRSAVVVGSSRCFLRRAWRVISITLVEVCRLGYSRRLGRSSSSLPDSDSPAGYPSHVSPAARRLPRP
ncbi:hypothetical protein PF002_g26790 [Phytophthora fragariae]|uniref:Glycosyl transferase 48 domain-containing protein n=1 Tax=Phytophthora fragariae TaxID=53985 RepID=A0A6A3WD20_9STRA|nr:hypothetical protein PF002_g26790 [Phytophthora fragariae]